MSNKQIDKLVCKDCDSEYKVIYDTSLTSGFTKYCPFCGEEHEPDDDDDFIKEDEEE